MSRMDVSHLQSSECILKLPRATPGAIHLVSPSGFKKRAFGLFLYTLLRAGIARRWAPHDGLFFFVLLNFGVFIARLLEHFVHARNEVNQDSKAEPRNEGWKP